MKNQSKKTSFVICCLLAVIYVLVIAKLVIFKNGFTNEFRDLSMMPFSFVIDFLNGEASLSNMLKNALGNIAVFIPLGIIVPVFFQKFNVKHVVLCGIIISFIIEIIQYITGLGITDIDDLILNTLGTFIGGLLYFQLSRKLDLRLKNYFATVLLLCILGISSASALYYFGFGSNLVAVQPKVINHSVLNGLDPDSSNIELSSCNLQDGYLSGILITYDTNSNEELQESKSYKLNSNTQYFTRTISTDYSPNGNVRQVIITYNKITQAEFTEILERDNNIWVNLWLDVNGNCSAVMITLHES